MELGTAVIVAWSGQILTRPAKLLTRILDRLRCQQLQKKVFASPLPDPVKKEIADNLAFTEAAKADFATSLANATAIELNKRSVGGAQHSHVLDVLLCAGELTAQHFDTMDRIEKAVATYLASMEKPKEPAKAETKQVKPGE